MSASRRPALYRDEFDRFVLEPYVFREGRIVFDSDSAPEAEAYWDAQIKPLSNYASISVLSAVISMVVVIASKATLALLVAQLFVLLALAILLVRTQRLKRWMAEKGLTAV